MTSVRLLRVAAIIRNVSFNSLSGRGVRDPETHLSASNALETRLNSPKTSMHSEIQLTSSGSNTWGPSRDIILARSGCSAIYFSSTFNLECHRVLNSFSNVTIRSRSNFLSCSCTRRARTRGCPFKNERMSSIRYRTVTRNGV